MDSVVILVSWINQNSMQIMISVDHIKLDHNICYKLEIIYYKGIYC